MKLTQEQTEQLKKQVENHRHKRYQTDIFLKNISLNNFIVEPNVMRPEVMTSMLVANWLAENSGIYEGQRILDMGCGTGILGIVTSRAAKSVKLADISLDAVINTAENLKRFDHENKCSVVQSDLFYNVNGEFDLIIFNQPYFPITPREFDPKGKYPILVSMCGGDGLINNFLYQAKHYRPKSRLLMSFYHILPDTNNPAVRGPKHGYKVETMLHTTQKDGLQQGDKSIYLLYLR